MDLSILEWNVCRICLREGDMELHSIVETQNLENNRPSIAAKLRVVCSASSVIVSEL